MRTRRFGNTELRVSEFGFGCARIGGVFQASSESFIALVKAANDAGINFFDTADMYSQGESEIIVGRAFRGRRDQVVIATKAGYVLPGRRRLIQRIKPLLKPVIQRLGLKRRHVPGAARGALTQDFSPDYITKAVEGSLRRLRTDYIDLLQLHSPPADVVERGEWHSALERLKQQGKIRYYGISCDSVGAGLAALKFAGVSSLQFMLNLLEQGAAEELVPEARSKGVAGIARETLANGLLIKSDAEIDFDKYTSSSEQRAHRREQLARYRQQAADQNRSLASLALGYVRDVDGVAVSLVGASSASQLGLLLKELPS